MSTNTGGACEADLSPSRRRRKFPGNTRRRNLDRPVRLRVAAWALGMVLSNLDTRGGQWYEMFFGAPVG